MLVLYFCIFQRGFEGLNAIFQALMYVNIVTALLYYIFFLISIHSLAEQSLRGTEVQKKEA